MELLDNKENFIAACDDLITCKYLVAEYKIQKLLQELAKCEEACNLIGDCLEEYNREREFSKTFVKNGYGDFICVMPEEEFKILALVFCTLVDIDNKKIDFTDFVKRFFGTEENPFGAFISTMVIPFRNLLAEAFGYPKIKLNGEEEEPVPAEEPVEEQELTEEEEGEEDKFVTIQKLAVQILSELQFTRQDADVVAVEQICKALVKTTDLKDEDITAALAKSLRFYKVKLVKFLAKEIYDMFE